MAGTELLTPVCPPVRHKTGNLPNLGFDEIPETRILSPTHKPIATYVKEPLHQLALASELSFDVSSCYE